jgi:hypothetical protein
MQLRKQHSPRVREIQHQSSALFAKTAGIFENLFCCANNDEEVDDATHDFYFPDMAFGEITEESYPPTVLSPSPSAAEKSTMTEGAIANPDSFFSSKGSGIVFLDATQPSVRPLLCLRTGSSFRTATTASMSSASMTTPSIEASQTFDSECSLFSTTSRSRSLSSITTAKCRPRDSHDESNLLRLEAESKSFLPPLSATDGYRC